jgi:hypothetical protein
MPMLRMNRLGTLTTLFACAAVPATADPVLFNNLGSEQYRV